MMLGVNQALELGPGLWTCDRYLRRPTLSGSASPVCCDLAQVAPPHWAVPSSAVPASEVAERMR